MLNGHTRLALVGVSAALALGACGPQDKAADGKTQTPSAAPAAPTLASGSPRLKPGLWRVAASGDGPMGESRMCLDEAVQARMNVIGAQAAPGSCQATETRARPGGGWTFRTACDMSALGGGTSVTEGEITGDLNSSYSSRSTVTTTGAEITHMNRAVTIASTGTYEGACPADMKPGDIEIPNGTRFNMIEMADMAARMRPPAP